MKPTASQLAIRMLTRPWFVVFLALAAGHQLSQKIREIPLPWVDSYLDPLLFMPILLQLILLERRTVFGQGNTYVLPILHIAIVFTLVCVLAEYLFPRWSDRFTADIWDVACYAIGALTFACWWNKPI